MEKISRIEAISLGLTHYFTGKPCPNGHISKRFVSSYTCQECANMHKRRYRKDPEFRKKELAYKAEYREKNRDAINEYAARRWRECEKYRANKLEYNRRNKDKRRKQFIRYYWENRDDFLQRMKNWRDQNKGYFYQKNAERRARKLNADGFFTKKDVMDLLSKQRHKCANCKKCVKRSYHVDHIYPLSKGGSNWPENLQILCPRCNRSKHAKDPIEWAQMNGRLL